MSLEPKYPGPQIYGGGYKGYATYMSTFERTMANSEKQGGSRARPAKKVDDGIGTMTLGQGLIMLAVLLVLVGFAISKKDEPVSLLEILGYALGLLGTVVVMPICFGIANQKKKSDEQRNTKSEEHPDADL